jgi:hypothetical protein
LSESTATGSAATLRLSAPNVVRGGLFFQSRVEVRALRAIEHPRLVLAGRVLEKNLRRQRMTIEELGAEARLAQIGSLGDVRYAVLESDGKVSFLTRS